MKLSEFKQQLETLSALEFVLPNGTAVPAHFHVTEVGQVSKHFIDCGGTVRIEKKVNFQLWEANDFDHRLAPQKLKDIIRLSEEKLALEDGEIEIEYQAETIGKYGLKLENGKLHLTNMYTNCLASDSCGIPPEKLKVRLADIQVTGASCCGPNTKCC
jgi:ribosomal protein L31E